MTNRTTPRVDLAHAHGSPTSYLYTHKGCRCVACRAAGSAHGAAYRAEHRQETIVREAAYRAAHHQEKAAYMASYNAAHHQEKAAYYAANRDAQLAYSATYRDAHRRDIAAYKAGRREESAAHSRSRRSREHGNGGAHTAADIRAQHERQRGRCYYCEVEVGETYHVDHVVPITKGGSNDPSNLVIACPRCNLSKRDKLPHEFAGRLC